MEAAELMPSVSVAPFCRKIWLEAFPVFTSEPSKRFALPSTDALLTKKGPIAVAIPMVGGAAWEAAATRTQASRSRKFERPFMRLLEGQQGATAIPQFPQYS